MQAFLLVLHVLLAIGLIALILLQHGRGADAGAAFGSGASATVFGSRGSASFLTRITTFLAVVFFANSLGLAYLSAQAPEDRSILERFQQQRAAEESAPPVAPEQAPGGQAPAGDAGTAETETAGRPADLPAVDE